MYNIYHVILARMGTHSSYYKWTMLLSENWYLNFISTTVFSETAVFDYSLFNVDIYICMLYILYTYALNYKLKYYPLLVQNRDKLTGYILVLYISAFYQCIKNWNLTNIWKQINSRWSEDQHCKFPMYSLQHCHSYMCFVRFFLQGCR